MYDEELLELLFVFLYIRLLADLLLVDVLVGFALLLARLLDLLLQDLHVNFSFIYLDSFLPALHVPH